MGRRLGALIVVVAVALTARVVGTSAMRQPDGTVRPVSSDSHYYLRRIVATYQNFPHVPDRDAGLGCPEGTVPPWPGGIERLTAGLAHLVLPASAPVRDVERLAAWTPVVAGVVTAAATWALATAWLGALAGLLAGLLLGLLPLHIWYTAFGFVDHHMLLGLWLAALAWSVDALLDRPARRETLLLGVILGLGHALMTEAWIAELVVTAAALLTATTALPAGPDRRGVLRAMVLAVGLGALLATPVIVQAPYFVHGLVAPHAPSRFTLWLLGGFVAALTAGLAGIGPDADKRSRALALAALTGAAAVALAALTDTDMRHAFAALLDFSGRAGMVATIEESKPFWRQPLPQPFFVLGGAVVLLPLLPLGFAHLPPLRRHWLIWLYVATAALALLQTRFGLVFAVPYVLAWSAVLTLQAVVLRRTLAVLGALSVLTLVPPLVEADHWSAHEESVWRMLVWMRDRLPPPSTGNRCVLAPWDVGHKILHVTGQPVIASNFTELKERDALQDAMRVLLASDFARAEPVLQRRQVRWLWTMATPWSVLTANAEEIGMQRPDLEHALAYVGTRLLLDAGTARGSAVGTGTLRRVHVSPLELPSLWQGQVRGPLREIALFERVRGARLVGQAPAGTLVTATVEIKHPGPPAFVFRQVGQADAAGRFTLQVPYATQDMPYGLVARSPWRVTFGGQTRDVQVPERAVQEGANVTIP